MKQEERIEYVRSFLQERIDKEFPYPFQISYEDGQFVFRLRSGKKECCARLRQTEEMITRISGGTRERKEEELKRLFEILHAALAARESTALSECSDYEKVKNELILRPLNYQYVKAELEDVPHIRIGDIALVLYAVMSRADGDYFTAKMHRCQMEKWKCPEQEVLETAMINTCFLYPPRLYCVEDLLSWDGKRHEDGRFMAEGEPLKIRRGMRGYILTNTLEINGAIAVFYPGVARKIAECFGEDFYIAFTSIHEAQIHSRSMISPEIVGSSLRDTNKHCNRQEETLTDKVYCYSLERRCFGLVEEGEFLEVYRDA